MLILSACDNNQHSSSTTINTLLIGVLPDQNQESLQNRYQPLINYIEESTGLDCQLYTPASYNELLEWFHTGKINMALFGGYTFIKALHDDDAIPIAMRDIDEKFTSVILVNKKYNAHSLQDLKGMTFSFGSELSTSGHLMPRYFFNKENIIPEDFFSEIIYSGAHDKTVNLILDGKVDAGVANANIIKNMFLNGTITTSEVNVIWESAPYPDYVWAISKNFDNNTRMKILNTFLALSPQQPSHKEILKNIGANYFIPASKLEFKMLEQAIDSLRSVKSPS